MRHPYADLINEWVEDTSRQIQYKRPNDEKWFSWISGPLIPDFDPNFEWRFKPKTVKREGWVNVYPTGYSYGYPTKEEADHQQGVLTGRVACIRIEWEEEA